MTVSCLLAIGRAIVVPLVIELAALTCGNAATLRPIREDDLLTLTDVDALTISPDGVKIAFQIHSANLNAIETGRSSGLFIRMNPISSHIRSIERAFMSGISIGLTSGSVVNKLRRAKILNNTESGSR